MIRNLITKCATSNQSGSGSREKRSAIFIDRDGVINENRMDYVKTWDEFSFLPGALEALQMLSKGDWTIVIFSNQSAIGRGLTSESAVNMIHSRMTEIVQSYGGRIDAIYYCPHLPDDDCGCRKPKPGLLLKAAKDLNLDLSKSYVIGDAVSDMEAGVTVNSTPIFVLTGRGENELLQIRSKNLDNIHIVENLLKAVDLIREAEKHKG